jgi:LPXTG-motif cell wall-anchored protein
MRAVLAFGITGAVVVTTAGATSAAGITASDDAAATDVGTAVAINVADNDDVDDGALTVTVAAPATTTSGNNTASGLTVTYTPQPGFTGTDTFQYEICATFEGEYGTGDTRVCDTAAVAVTVNGAEPQPQVAANGATDPPVTSPPTAAPNGVGVQGAGAGGSTLPQTGSDGPLALLAAALVVGGASCFVATRDRARVALR